MGGSDHFDAEDLQHTQFGDADALRRVIDRFSQLVYRVALRITQVEADAEDVTQEVFIALPEALEHFDGDEFESWLTVVTTRRALMFLRSERRVRAHDGPTPRRVSLEEQVLSRLTVRKALGHIDPDLRAVFLLKELDGHSHAEIAEALDISVSLSQVRLYRAREALRKLLSR